MPLKRAITGQYRASLAMLRETIELCPVATWEGGTHPRNFWRIAYHALHFTHLYLMPSPEEFVRWELHRDCTDLWNDANPPVVEPYTQAEILEYLDYIDSSVSGWVDRLDLESMQSGFSWYPNLPKLDHQILTIRHLAGHAGQLSELIMQAGIEEIKWITRVPR